MRDVILRNPDENEISKLKALWSEVFSSVGMDAFFNNLYENELCNAVFSGKELCAMGYLVPMGKLLCDGEALDCAMIYSVATAPLHRGKGYAKAVVDELVINARDLGYPVVVLLPSDDALFDFYRKNNGFEDWFYTNEQIYTKAGLPELHGKKIFLENISTEDYLRMRESLLSEHTYIKQDVRILEYQRLICDEMGGGLYRIGDSCAVLEVQDDLSVFVKELLSPEDNHSDVVGAIADAYPSQHYIVRTPATYGNRMRLGMIKREKKVPAESAPVAPAGSPAPSAPLPWYGLALD